MPKITGIAIVTVGVALILSALLLLCRNRQEDLQAGLEAESLLESIEAAIETKKTPAPTADQQPEATPSAPPLVPEMPVVLLDGYEYIGCVEIPVQGLKLPVMAQWDYDRLKLAPCRQFGSSRTDDLVIAAHNYDSHFGRLKDLSAGDPVLFTDMEGVVSAYCVEKIETLSPNEVDAVQNSGYDLVLYTCTKGGALRVTAFCNRKAASAPSPAPTQMEK